MVFVYIQKQNKSYTFKDMLLQPDKSDFILAMIEEFETHSSRSHWTLMKKSEVNNEHKIKYGKIKTILSIWSFKRNIVPYQILMKHKSRLSAFEE